MPNRTPPPTPKKNIEVHDKKVASAPGRFYRYMEHGKISLHNCLLFIFGEGVLVGVFHYYPVWVALLLLGLMIIYLCFYIKGMFDEERR